MLSLSRNNLDRFIFNYALIPADFSFLNLVSSQFIHGGFLHIIGNMLFLYIFGESLEGAIGHFRYFLFYLTCGIVAGLTQCYSDFESSIPIIGASGAIAGVMGAYLILFPRAKVDVLLPFGIFFPMLTIPASILLIYWLVSQLIQGWGSVDTHGGGVGYFAHIGGFIAGIIFISIILKTRYKKI